MVNTGHFINWRMLYFWVHQVLHLDSVVDYTHYMMQAQSECKTVLCKLLQKKLMPLFSCFTLLSRQNIFAHVCAKSLMNSAFHAAFKCLT